MAYPHDLTPKKLRVIEKLRDNLADIRQQNNYFTDVERAVVYQGEDIVLGMEMPAVVLVPETADEHTDRMICATAEHLWTIALLLVLRIGPGVPSETWNTAITWFVADAIKAVEDDIQLGGLATYVEVSTDEVFDVGPDDQIVEAKVTVDVHYRHKIGDPSV